MQVNENQFHTIPEQLIPLLQYKAISLILKLISHIFILFISALQPEQDLDPRKLGAIDVIEAKEASKQSTLVLIQQIRCNLTKVGLQTAALPEDQAHQYMLTISLPFV